MFFIALLLYLLFWFTPGMIGVIMYKIGKRRYGHILYTFEAHIDICDILLAAVLGWLCLILGLISYFGVVEKINSFIDETADRKEKR